MKDGDGEASGNHDDSAHRATAGGVSRPGANSIAMAEPLTLDQYLSNLAKWRDNRLIDQKSHDRQAAAARQLAAQGKPMPATIETKRARRGFWKAFDRASESW